MAIMIVNVTDNVILHQEFASMKPIEDDLGTYRVITFTGENEAYVEHSTGMGHMLPPDEAQGLFDRFKGIWVQARGEADALLHEQRQKQQAEEAEQQAARDEFERKRKEPILVAPSKEIFLSRLSDDELDDFQRVLKHPRFNLIWTQSEGLGVNQERLIRIMTDEEWPGGEDRVRQLFAQVNINPNAE